LERPSVGSPPNITTNGTLNCLNPPSTSSSSSKPTHYGYSPQDLGSGSNPYDIAFIGNTGYIALYGTNSVRIFDTDSCKLGSTIQLPSTFLVQYSSSSVVATANAASIKTDGTKLYVVMQTWKSYPDTATNGILVRLNTNGTPNNPYDIVQLKYYNPQSSVLKNDTLYIASAYNLSSPPGIDTTKSGIEYLNGLTASTTTKLISGYSLGGRGPTSMVLGNGVLWTIAYKEWTTDLDAKVMSVSLVGSVDSTRVPSANKATCLVYDNNLDYLFIGNATAFSTTPASLIRYNTISNSTTTIGNSTAPAALPPYSLAILRY